MKTYFVPEFGSDYTEYYVPLTEKQIDGIMQSHPELTRNYVISKHKEIYDSTTDEEIEEYYRYSLENDFDTEISREDVKKIILGRKQADAKLSIDADILISKEESEEDGYTIRRKSSS